MPLAKAANAALSKLLLGDIPDRLTPDEFWELLGEAKHESLDFKRGVPADIADTIPAMAMTDGGLIVHGIRDDRVLTGCPLSQNTTDRVKRYAYECGLEVAMREVTVGDIKLTITEVPAIHGRIVTTPDGRLLRRVGGDCQPLRGDAMARFVQDRSGGSAEDEPTGPLCEGDFNLDRINQALSAEGGQPVNESGLAQALIDLRVASRPVPATDVQPVKAAAVLFAHDPRKFIPRAAVQLVRREGVQPGLGPTVSRAECHGPLVDVLDGAMAFIGDQTRSVDVVLRTYRETLPEYPEAVLREAILNALAHRDYGIAGTTVDITIWDDGLQVTSPGGLPAPVTVDNIRNEHSSRNPKLMRVLKGLGLVEEYGEGVDRMFREMEARLLEPPVFTATPSSVKVMLYNRSLVDVEDQAWLGLLESWRLSKGERLALVVAQREGHVTPRRLREFALEEDPAAVLAGATAKGLLDRNGQRGGSRYSLSAEVLVRAGSSGIEARRQRRQTLLDAMRAGNGISTAEGARLIDASMPATRELLQDLVRAGMARAEGRTRGRRYYAT